ncbi:phytoene desaturase family protein [Acuticoccus mangrovi]|uniref:Pyridine nucleotide-disulfide oxidoreductase domain-containing protein 2 n=1 Tax=Acuticoccus mangrovi TaxID=2796142 RepID=A0A934IUE8_9HYPH|nr:NAD(P)/FAD-dependent oxidoreductase [Acuticoccus mangrovi]MBJ3777924.1 NAD(P)/FAD-dependent oxidoreductase [Acuticoccus mangrovi]
MADATYDAVVIGAGHNGLAAALHMASRGMSVALFEAADTVGGAIRTEEITLPGFRHDLFAMNLSLFAGSPFAAEHGETLAAHGLAYAPASDCFASAFADGSFLGVSTDVETNVARIAQKSPADADAWQRLSEGFAADAPHLFAVLGTPMRRRAVAGLLWRTVRAKGWGWTLETMRLLASSPRDFLDATFEHPDVKALLAPWAMHLDFPPDAAGGALFPYLEAMADQAFGMVVGKGGADVVPRALAGAVRAAGGAIHTASPVAEIVREGGRAAGVRLAGGEVVAARRVVASVTPSGLLRLLGGSTGDAATDRRLTAFRHGPGTMMIHIAATSLPDWRAGDDLKRFAYVHLAPSLATLSRAYAEAMAGCLPAEPAIVVGQPTAIDPSRAPHGRHVLWLQVRVVPGTVRGDALDAVRPGAWADIKEAMADRVVDIVERYAPGFATTILARTVMAPDDLERMNRNLVGGDSLGGSHHLFQNFLFRPAIGMADHATPVAGLFMVGASTWPGAGAGAGSGYMVGRRLAGR